MLGTPVTATAAPVASAAASTQTASAGATPASAANSAHTGDTSSLPTEADLVTKPAKKTPKASSKAATKVDGAAVPAPAVAAAAAESVRVASTGGGNGFLVQVGAFTSQDIANTEASQISSKYSDLLKGLNQDIQRADLGAKGVYFRLRFGPFGSRDEATERCTALKARGQACVIIAGASG